METENASPTQGSDQGGYIPVSSGVDSRNSPISAESKTSGDKFGLQYVRPLFESLQDNLAFSAILINIIGYIIISSFGHMDGIGNYVRYVIFLLLNFILYKFLGRDKLRVDFKNINLFLILGLLILLIFILIEHNIFILAGNYIADIITKK